MSVSRRKRNFGQTFEAAGIDWPVPKRVFGRDGVCPTAPLRCLATVGSGAAVDAWIAWNDVQADAWTMAAALLVEHPNDASKIAFALAIENLNAGLFARAALWSQVVTAVEQLKVPLAGD